jgi:hypothetical protein
VHVSSRRLYFCHAHTILSREPGGVLPVRVRAGKNHTTKCATHTHTHARALTHTHTGALRNNDDVASTAVIAAFTTNAAFIGFADVRNVAWQA